MFFFFNDPAPPEIYTLSLHDALPIYDQIILPHASLEPRDPGVELPQSLMKPRHVVAVPPRLVEFEHVDEDEPALAAVERLLDQPVRIPVGRGVLARDRPARE